VAWELRHPVPLLDVRLFRERRLATGSGVLLVVFGVQAGVSIVLFPFFQTVLGWSGLVSTVALLPMAGVMMGASGLAPRLAERVGARATMATGIALGGLGLVLMAVFVDSGYLTVLPGMIAMGAGMGLSMPPATEAITSALPQGQQGVASALNDVTREFGTALGVASLGAMVAGAVDAGESFVEGWRTAMWTGVAVMAVLLVSVLRPRSGGRPASAGARHRTGSA
jgi:MFS family permease